MQKKMCFACRVGTVFLYIMILKCSASSAGSIVDDGHISSKYFWILRVDKNDIIYIKRAKWTNRMQFYHLSWGIKTLAEKQFLRFPEQFSFLPLFYQIEMQ